MNDHSIPTDDDEIDLAELVLAIWSGRRMILTMMTASVLAAIVYAQSLEPEYTSQAVFELVSVSSGPSISSEYAGLASLAGLSLGSTQSKGIFDRLAGRDFIQLVSDDLNLTDDAYFNSPEQPIRRFSLANVKLALGLAGEEANLDDRIARIYEDSVEVSETKYGSIEVSVVHHDPERAAEVANGIVNRLIRDLTQEQLQERKAQLAYLSEQLANSLTKMETTRRGVADFALANSLASSQAFTTRSQAMFNLREDLKRAQEMAAAVSELSSVMAAEVNPSDKDYQVLRAEFPIVDDLNFRRRIGMPEALDAWEWPPASRLGGFSSTLLDRVARIQRSISELADEAERYASLTEQLSALEREARVAEATYNVLIEQVKAQAISTGYQGEIAKYYQSALPPEQPTAPKKSLIVALGAVLGVFLGVAIALTVSQRRGRLYSMRAIENATAATIYIKAPALGRVSMKSAKQLLDGVAKVSTASLSTLVVRQRTVGRKVSMIASTAPRLVTFPTALWLARRATGLRFRTAIFVFGEILPPDLKFKDHESILGLSHASLDGVTIFRESKGASVEDVLTSDKVRALLSTGSDEYDRVIISAVCQYAFTVTLAFTSEEPFMVFLTRPAQTLKSIVSDLRGIAKPDTVVSV